VFVHRPFLKTFCRIGKFFGVVNRTFITEICGLDPVTLCQRDAVRDQGSSDSVERWLLSFTLTFWFFRRPDSLR
jgi:hypothetical protein